MRARELGLRALLLVPALLAACAKSPDEWIADLEHADPFVREVAAAALGESPLPEAEAALTALRTCRDDDDPAVRERVRRSLTRLVDASLDALLAEPDLATLTALGAEEEIADALRRGGPRVAETLARRLGEESTPRQRLVARLLAGCGPAAVEPACRLLSDAEPLVRARAAYALRLVGEEARDALPALRAAAADPSPLVRREAVVALQAVDARRGIGIDEVLRAADDPDAEVRAAAEPARLALAATADARARFAELCAAPVEASDASIAALCALGDAAVAVLIENLESEQRGAPRRALLVLVELLDAGDPDTVPPADALELARELERRVAEDDAERGSRVAFELARLGAAAAPARDALVRALDARAASTRACAALALGRLRRPAHALRPELARLAQDPVPLVRQVAHYAAGLLE